MATQCDTWIWLSYQSLVFAYLLEFQVQILSWSFTTFFSVFTCVWLYMRIRWKYLVMLHLELRLYHEWNWTRKPIYPRHQFMLLVKKEKSLTVDVRGGAQCEGTVLVSFIVVIQHVCLLADLWMYIEKFRACPWKNCSGGEYGFHSVTYGWLFVLVRHYSPYSLRIFCFSFSSIATDCRDLLNSSFFVLSSFCRPPYNDIETAVFRLMDFLFVLPLLEAPGF